MIRTVKDTQVGEIKARFDKMTSAVLVDFKGMTVEPVDLGELVAVRIRLMDDLKHGLDPAERKFFLSLVAAEPDWTLLGLPHLEHLPAIRWKLQNLEKLKKADPRRFAQQSETLASLLA